jgi:hypothetical protein
MAEFKQMSVPITLHTRADEQFMEALERATKQHERDVTHDLDMFEDKDHDPNCDICARRREEAKYCHECGREYDE